MPDIHIERTHTLGLPAARVAARRWIERVEQQFGLTFDYEEGALGDAARFAGAGIDGTLTVTADAIEIAASLGFLYGAFSETIRTRISQNLDELLDPASAGRRNDRA